MKRIWMAAFLAIPLALTAGAASAHEDGVGDYYFKDLRKAKHGRSDGVLRRESKACFTALGYEDLATNMPAFTADPRYQSCMQAHGWRLASYKPPRHRAHHQSQDAYVPPSDSGPDSSAQRSIDQTNAQMASDAQNAAAQAQNNAAMDASTLYMNQMNADHP
jgi:hypothetical protein